MSPTETRVDAPSEGVLGIHHVTAIATDPQRNLDFYAGLLGLRLVKRTINFDDPGTYHFYYGDEAGRPGTILTFFPWPQARRGSRGPGQVTRISFAVPTGSLGFWSARLAAQQVAAEPVRRASHAEALRFLDPDGLELELVEEVGSLERPFWEAGGVAGEQAVRAIVAAELTVGDGRPTWEVLTGALGLAAAEDPSGLVLAADGRERVEIRPVGDTGWGRVAAGSIHHIAWRARDEAHQLALRATLVEQGLHVTPVLDRNYFRSIYFREPGGVLFEIATDPPGFTVDESVAELGSTLKLPLWLEGERAALERALPTIEVPTAGVATAESGVRHG